VALVHHPGVRVGSTSPFKSRGKRKRGEGGKKSHPTSSSTTKRKEKDNGNLLQQCHVWTLFRRGKRKGYLSPQSLMEGEKLDKNTYIGARKADPEITRGGKKGERSLFSRGGG